MVDELSVPGFLEGEWKSQIKIRRLNYSGITGVGGLSFPGFLGVASEQPIT